MNTYKYTNKIDDNSIFECVVNATNEEEARESVKPLLKKHNWNDIDKGSFQIIDNTKKGVVMDYSYYE